ncbi:COX15/CtaA family protein [Cyclobacterium jeungdonense]|uniref:COX15/CtaA family protein n=1 Tax=Cyclobacterium jeungdonense TaxID=708087 RepID=A0ABT8C3A4_9BACT|nr:COX15/CtaA family protein [Cyclobacterium jeungdonense]MDN3687191.1 COX15/CtaA family protein [Cyclobacterium jeungdonense]
MKQKNLNKVHSFRRISLITTVAVFFLILVGGIVRSTGAGMGCPDWPKCFGSWIPPTSVDQLPVNYAEIYLQKRVEKNERFVSLLNGLGFSSLARQIEEDKSILSHEPFNATKTWIEYVNRLIGVAIGLLIILTFVQSIRLRKLDYKITFLSLLALIAVVFQGWLGSIVVSTNLLQWMISLHMIVALLLVCLLLYIYFRSGNLVSVAKGEHRTIFGERKWVRGWLGIGMVLMFVQIVLGTQVREHIDVIASEFGYQNRGLWISELGTTFYIHRSFSLLLIGLHIYLFYKVSSSGERKVGLVKRFKWLVGLMIVVVVSGVVMAYLGIPAFVQPLHLLLGSLIIGFQYYIWLELGVVTYHSEEKVLV